MATVVEQVTVEIDGEQITVERLSDGTFRKPAYLTNFAPLAKVPASGVGIMTSKGAEAGWNVTKHQLIMPPPTSDAAKQFDGWGTALKPAWEPFIVAVKPDWLVGTSTKEDESCNGI